MVMNLNEGIRKFGMGIRLPPPPPLFLIVELLLAEGADVNAKDKYGLTPLHRAASGGHTETAELLITEGADVNAKNEDGKTPLDRAIKYNQTETADLLHKHGGKTKKERSS